MAIKRESDTKKTIEYYITRPDGVTKTFEVDQNTPYSESKSRRPGEMFSVQVVEDIILMEVHLAVVEDLPKD